jgi:hypothetical protein
MVGIVGTVGIVVGVGVVGVVGVVGESCNHVCAQLTQQPLLQQQSDIISSFVPIFTTSTVAFKQDQNIDQYYVCHESFFPLVLYGLQLHRGDEQQDNLQQPIDKQPTTKPILYSSFTTQPFLSNTSLFLDDYNGPSSKPGNGTANNQLPFPPRFAPYSSLYQTVVAENGHFKDHNVNMSGVPTDSSSNNQIPTTLVTFNINMTDPHSFYQLMQQHDCRSSSPLHRRICPCTATTFR